MNHVSLRNEFVFQLGLLIFELRFEKELYLGISIILVKFLVKFGFGGIAGFWKAPYLTYLLTCWGWRCDVQGSVS